MQYQDHLAPPLEYGIEDTGNYGYLATAKMTEYPWMKEKKVAKSRASVHNTALQHTMGECTKCTVS
jgi:hypothetical protein